mmetsp:Transcript_18061/g.63903  ORF Transcript_18061/g.63903 Transcript_18061/m.63903 type:complete len:244 (-) Transcript_18061:222-953(-)
MTSKPSCVSLPTAPLLAACSVCACTLAPSISSPRSYAVNASSRRPTRPAADVRRFSMATASSARCTSAASHRESSSEAATTRTTTTVAGCLSRDSKPRVCDSRDPYRHANAHDGQFAFTRFCMVARRRRRCACARGLVPLGVVTPARGDIGAPPPGRRGDVACQLATGDPRPLASAARPSPGVGLVDTLDGERPTAPSAEAMPLGGRARRGVRPRRASVRWGSTRRTPRARRGSHSRAAATID